MTSFPGSPRVLKGGIVMIDPSSGAILRVIALQYNPDQISRTLKILAAGEGGDRLEALRLKGPPNETIKLEAEIDATDQLEFPDQNPTTAEFGIFPQLAALETIVYPTSAVLELNNTLAQRGTLQLIPAETPLMLFVWSKFRIVPARLTEFSVTEEAFDTTLNPIRAKVSLTMQVLSVNDLDFAHRGSALFMSYLKAKERLAGMGAITGLSTFGIAGIP